MNLGEIKMEKFLKTMVFFFIFINLSNPSQGETISSNYGFSIEIPNGFQLVSSQIPAGAPNGMLDARIYSNQKTFEQIVITTARLQSDFFKEMKTGWQNAAEAYAVAMSAQIRDSIKTTNGMDCLYKASPLYKKNDYEFSVQSNFTCFKDNQKFTAVYFAASFASKEGIHGYRMQCAVNTEESCKQAFLQSWNSLRINSASKLQ